MGAVLQQAAAMLQAGRPSDAAALCRKVLALQPGQADALHLLARAMQDSGQPAEAEKLFLASLSRAPRQPDILVNYGNFLRAQGRLKDARQRLRKAVKIAPDLVPAWRGLSLTLRGIGELQEAAKCAQKVTLLAPEYSAGWELLAAIEQKLKNPSAAIAACRCGLRRTPEAPRLLYSLAQLLRQECEFAEAAKLYQSARLQGYDTADSYRNQADALLEAGETEQALVCATSGVTRFPEDRVLQRTRAALHWETAADGDPTEMLAQATRRFPGNAALWETLGQLLNRLERKEECAAMVSEALQRGCPDTPELLRLDALASVHAGASVQATDKFSQLLSRYPQHVGSKLSFAEHLLRIGEPDYAEKQCAEVLELNPRDQLAWAYRGTAWQLLSDPREGWLMDYERMVRPVAVATPEGFTDTADFFRELKVCLESLHRTEAHPIQQTLRGGTQTNGHLFRLKHPILGLLEQQIRLAVNSVLTDFPDDSQHPFWGRRPPKAAGDQLTFSGAWSVRLRSEGFHTNHIHPEGWISSALYIALPDDIDQGEGHAGHIQFGVPLAMDLPPKRTIHPQIGTLVLFPSYMWHGTVPFTSPQPRITVAFDLIPEE